MLTTEWQAPCSWDQGQCIEVRRARGLVQIRNNVAPMIAPVEATIGEWRAFVEAVKAGEYDLPH